MIGLAAIRTMYHLEPICFRYYIGINLGTRVPSHKGES